MVDHFNPGTGNVLHAKTVIQSRIKTGSLTFNKAVLHQKYIVERRSMRQIAAEFASSKTAVRNALKTLGITLRERWKNPYRSHNLPFGKKLNKGKVIDYEWEQEVIRSIVKMHEDRLSSMAIARALTAMRIPVFFATNRLSSLTYIANWLLCINAGCLLHIAVWSKPRRGLHRFVIQIRSSALQRCI